MTIRVVKSEPHPSVVREAICPNCGATLEYTPQDMKEGCRSDYLGDRDYYRYIPCPPCGHEIRVRGY